VVEGADKIVVRLTDKREFEGKVLGTAGISCSPPPKGIGNPKRRKISAPCSSMPGKPKFGTATVRAFFVVEGADKIVVRLTDKREFEGKVLGTDKQTDIAVVKIEAKDLPALKMGDSNQLKVGEWVAAIGSPPPELPGLTATSV